MDNGNLYTENDGHVEIYQSGGFCLETLVTNNTPHVGEALKCKTQKPIQSCSLLQQKRPSLNVTDRGHFSHTCHALDPYFRIVHSVLGVFSLVK